MKLDLRLIQNPSFCEFKLTDFLFFSCCPAAGLALEVSCSCEDSWDDLRSEDSMVWRLRLWQACQSYWRSLAGVVSERSESCGSDLGSVSYRLFSFFLTRNKADLKFRLQIRMVKKSGSFFFFFLVERGTDEGSGHNWELWDHVGWEINSFKEDPRTEDAVLLKFFILYYRRLFLYIWVALCQEILQSREMKISSRHYDFFSDAFNMNSKLFKQYPLLQVWEPKKLLELSY